MRKLAIVLALSLFVATAAFPQTYGDNCPWVQTNWSWGCLDWSDGSAACFTVTTYTDCLGNTAVLRSYPDIYCPGSATDPCMARDLWASAPITF